MSFNHTFIPQGGCCQWQPQLIGLHAVSDLLIALADYSIPAFLIYFAYRSRECALSKGLLLLGAWFFCDGTTHMMEFWNLGHPYYWRSGFVKALTAVISWLTLAAFAPLIPRFMAVFSPLRIAAEKAAIPNFTASIATEKTADRQPYNPLKTSLTEPGEISEQLIAEIARRQQIEEKLLETSEKLRATIFRFQHVVKSNAIAGIGFWDITGTITEANNTLLEIVGYTPADLSAGKINLRAITPPEYADLDDSAQQEILNYGYFHPYKKEFIRSCGRRVPIAIGGAMFENPDSGVFFVQDLTEQTLTERFNFLEVLRQSEERFRIAAESASDLIYEWDLNTDILLWFGHIDEHLKYERGAFPRTIAAWKSILHPDDRDRITLAVDDYLNTCKDAAAPFFQEYRVVTREGDFLYWIDRGKAVFDNRGNPCKWIGVISDITDRKQAESERNLALAREQTARRQAEASEQLYRVLAEAIPQIVWTALPDGWIDYYNARWFEYTGMTLEQTQGWGWQSVLHPMDVQNCLDGWNTSVQTGETYEVEYRFLRASDGSYRWHLGRAKPVRDADGKIIKWFGTCTDIDDRKREAQTAYFRAQALALLSASLDSEEVLQGLTDLAVPGLADWCCVHLIEAEGSIRLVAVAHSDPTKVSLLWQIDRRSPIDPHARHGLAKVLRSGESKVYAEIPDSVLEAVVPDAELLNSLRAQGPLSVMCVPLIARGRTLGAISLLSAESGRRYGRADLDLVEDWARDVAVAIDNARLYREAAEANRIKDEFLATLSHELRTPLNAISGWAQMLRQRKLSPEKTAVALETIERNARLQTQMIEDLLDVSRIVSGKVCLKLLAVDLVRTIEAALNTVRPDAETRQIELVSFYEAGVGPVIGDITRLQQVVWNLVSNAVKFTQPGGRVEVRLSSNSTNPPPIRNPKSPAPYVEITVSDTGIGISKEFLPFVFDRFRQADSSYTRNYGGLGLGLAIVRHLVEIHGGTVWAESPGELQGATFGVRLPI